jgi:hypothetical protein
MEGFREKKNNGNIKKIFLIFRKRDFHNNTLHNFL